MAGFDDVLATLHDNAGDARLNDNDAVIRITDRRTFDVPQDYNTILGYAGDINSQVVTFELPEKHEEHNLLACSNKILNWKNLASNVEGTSTLLAVGASEDSTLYKWEVPPEAMTQAGKLEIAISLYDTKNGNIAFSWNTPPYSGFSIGASFVHIGSAWTEGDKGYKMPAKNEILNVDIEGRQIIAPAGYNKIICNYGDIGTSKVFFVVNKFIRGIDIFDEAAAVYVNVAFSTDTTDWRLIDKTAIMSYSDNGNKAVICWDIPSDITNNNQKYVGNISISLKFEKTENGQITQRWVSSSFTQLSIGPSLMLNTIVDVVERDEEILERAIDNYFDEHYFVTEG